MSEGLSSTAMVLAAGLGKRMRPMTLNKPKPLQLVGGKTMLDHALDKLVAAGIKRAVVNTHYLAEQIETHLRSRHDIEIIISRESELLDTGGGIVKALSYFEEKPFISLNADLPWIDGSTPSLDRMKQKWDPSSMDALLLLMPTQKALGFGSAGDFAMDLNGRVWRKTLQPPRPYVWISAQILKPSLFEKPPAPVFSNNVIWDRVEEKHRLFGVEHDGTCYHVGTPEDWQRANDLLSSGKGWGV
jgi:N-acetyl-alpha-D-muramate 1-phosphate uridylyltransferase